MTTNDQKVIQTRSGTKIVMNDAEGSILIEDPSGNTWQMDGKGNINVNAPNDISITAGQNISLSAGANIIGTAGQNITQSAGLNLTESAGGMIAQTAVLDYTLMATNIMEIASEARNSKAKNVTEQADGIDKQSSNQDVKVQGNGKVITNSGEKGTSY